MTCPVHEITVGNHGHRHGTDGHITLSLLEEDGRLFKRRAIKNFGSENSEETCWLVAELDGVRVYQQGNHIVVTRQDLYP